MLSDEEFDVARRKESGLMRRRKKRAKAFQ
jgi:hypothetical protein